MPKTVHRVGDRVAVNDYVATIRYKGPVDGAKGEYYGVEWDLASRGKHNGMHAGKQYFQTSDGENSGSFIREKLIHPAVSCIEAISDKYGKVDDDLAGVDEEEAYLTQGEGGRVVKVEVVGMKDINDLQSRFDELKIIDLMSMLVYGETDAEALGTFVPKVEELNLAINLLSSWEDVGEIIKHLENLNFLHLRGNRLTYSTDITDEMKIAFARIRKLNLTFMNMNWEEVLQCSVLWPRLTELHLCKNRISVIPSCPQWENLQLLNLDMNSLKSWSNVKPFAKLPSVTELLLNECELADISVDEGDFPSLESLAIRNNNIQDWGQIGELNKIPTLIELVLMNNPVLETADAETNRQITIGRILNLRRHNRTKIELDERKGAEIDYTKRYGEAWILSGASIEKTEQNTQFYAEHPTYLHLINKWGAPEKTEVMKTKKTSALKDSLIDNRTTNRFQKCLMKMRIVDQLQVTFVDLVTESGKTVTKYIPDTMNVPKAKNLAMKLLGIKGIPCVISYRAQQNGEEYEFEYDLRSMTYYGVQHGDDILLRQVP